MKENLNGVFNKFKSKNKKNLVLAMGVLVLATTTLTACGDKAEEKLAIEVGDKDVATIADELIKSEDRDNTYYLKMEGSRYGEEDEKIDAIEAEEWYEYQKDGGFTRKIISKGGENVVLYTSPEEFIIHDIDQNTAEILNLNELDQEVIDDIESLNLKTVEMNTGNYLKKLAADYDMEVVGEEDLDGFKTIHISGKPREDMLGIIPNKDLWIDKHSAIVIKDLSSGEGFKQETKVVELKYNEKIAEENLKYEIPEDVEKVELGK